MPFVFAVKLLLFALVVVAVIVIKPFCYYAYCFLKMVIVFLLQLQFTTTKNSNKEKRKTMGYFAILYIGHTCVFQTAAATTVAIIAVVFVLLPLLIWKGLTVCSHKCICNRNYYIYCTLTCFTIHSRTCEYLYKFLLFLWMEKIRKKRNTFMFYIYTNTSVTMFVFILVSLYFSWFLFL